jgi:hypothetical protein
MKKLKYVLPLLFLFKTACGEGPHGRAVMLTKVEPAREAQRWERAMKKAEHEGSVADYARARLQQNYIADMTDAEEKGGDTAAVTRKYELLGNALEKEIADYKEKHPQPIGANFAVTLEPKDVVYKGPDFVSVYHPDTLKEVNRVFTDFGALYVKETRGEDGKVEQRSVRAKERPWSGYWYPFNNNTLYDGSDSVFAKLDRWLAKKKIPSKTQFFEAERYKAYTPETWEGLCDAWSTAAILHKEPQASKIVDGIEFSIADQKALLTFSHLQHPRKLYGISYKGNAQTDGTYQDMKPEAFHRIITHVLGREGRAVVIDDAAGPQVWNKPLYSYRWSIEQDPKADYIFNVRGYVRLINQRNSETEELTSERDYIIPTYEYRLYVDKKDVTSSGYRVIAGQWMNDSFFDHPDTLIYVPPFDAKKIGSYNEEFNRHLPMIRNAFFP